MRLKPLIEAALDVARAGPSEACLEHYAGETRQVDGLRSEASFSGFCFAIDEPKPYGGGTAANPAEMLLAAIGASIEATTRMYAELLDIPVQGVATKLSGSLDLRGFFDTDPAVRAGFERIDIAVEIHSSAPPADITRLIERVERCCPVLDIVRGGAAVRLVTDVKAPL